MGRPDRYGKGGFALVVTLALVTTLAIAIVGFFAGIASERITTRAFSNAARAQLAARAAKNIAIATLKAQFEAHPDSCTSWEELSDGDGDKLTEGTVFHYRLLSNGVAAPHLQPLMSGGIATPLSEKAGALERVNPSRPYSHPENSIDLNRARFPGDTVGWIGSPPGGRRTIRVPWVEMKEPTPPHKVIQRYAFWVEDESFKLNVNQMGTAPRGNNGDGLNAGQTPDQIPLHGFLRSAGPGNAPLAPVVTAVSGLRAVFPGGLLLDFGALNQLGTATLGDTGKFYGTLYSGALNLSRSGAQRLNLNALVADSASPDEIRGQLDRIIKAIETQLPSFGQRFYRLNADLNESQVTEDHAAIYLQKIAANLRDYLDRDSQPTIVEADGSVRIGAKPALGIEPVDAGVPFKAGDNPVLAIGKERIPYLQEFACRVNLRKMDPPKAKTGVTQAEYDFYLDYYFEFWNMTPRDVTAAELGPNLFLRVYDQPGFDAAGGDSIPAGRPFEIPIPDGVVFRAGRATVLTTDATPPGNLVPDLDNVVILPVPDAVRRYSGITTGTNSKKSFCLDLVPRSSASTDYETKMLLGNDHGLIESSCALPLVRGGSVGNNALQIHNDFPDTPEDYFIRGGSLHGGLSSQTGDPRTNNEQLYLRIYDEAGDEEQTRYYHSGLGNGAANVPAKSSLGFSNAYYVHLSEWPDPSPWSSTGIDTPMIVADEPMRSIGELGHLFDPARLPGPTNNILYSRGGGRTLAVGQPDPLWDKEPHSSSREWAAWRLADIFSTTGDLTLPGRININGVRRDGGAALKAALYGYQYSTGADADPHLLSEEFSQAAIDGLVARVTAWLDARSEPFAERGELSEALAFAPEFAPDVAAADLYDRGREEIFRRLVELVATRGSIFSVYAVGQAIAQRPDGEKVATATAQTKITFELIPQWNPSLPGTFDPGDPESIHARFRKPDAFKVKILQVSQ